MCITHTREIFEKKTSFDSIRSYTVRAGLDIPTLSACVFATPIGSVEQAVGRIQRPCATKRTPVECIDVVDTFSIFSHMARKRRKLYQAHKFRIVDSDARGTK